MTEFCFETINWSPYFGFDKPDLRAMIRIASETGFSAISFDLPSIAYFMAHDGSLAELRQSLDAHRLRLLAVHSLSIDDDVAGVAALTHAAMESCTALGADYFHAGVIAPVDANVVAATRRAERICRDSGVGFAIEFLPFLPVASIAETRALLDAAGIKGRNLVIDTWHFFNGPDDWDQLERISADEIAYIQFNDHGPLASDDLLHETTQNRVMPGEGGFDLERFAALFRRIGYDGVVGIEILSRAARAEPIAAVARRMIETTRPYWSAES